MESAKNRFFSKSADPNFTILTKLRVRPDGNHIIPEPVDLLLNHKAMKQPLNTKDYAKLGTQDLLDIISNNFHKEIRETFATVNLQLNIAHKLEPLEEELEFAQVIINDIEEKFTEHVQKEESFLFPILSATKKRAEYMEEENDMEEFISGLKSEHAILKTQFFKIRQATNQYTCEASSTPSHKLAYAQLNDLEQDINRLFFVEEEYFFPRIPKVQHK